MDEFLSDIYTLLFYKWVVSQNKLYSLDNSFDKCHCISLEDDILDSHIAFYPDNIIELSVYNKKKEDMEFYLHFQMNNLKHATSLFYEMKNTIDSLKTKPILQVLLCCSGGLTTSYFASKIQDAINLLGLNIQVEAVGYNRVYEVGKNYDMIFLAPQISYEYAKIQQHLSSTVIVKIPPQVFAKYDVNEMLKMIQAYKKDDIIKIEKGQIDIKRSGNLKGNVLCLSVYQSDNKNYIHYRIYTKNKEIMIDNEIVKKTISMNDIYDVLDTLTIQCPTIELVSLALPGIIYKGYVSKTVIENCYGDIGTILKNKYHLEFYMNNDVNMAALGYYYSQEEYDNLSFIFQPIGLNAGLGTIINGKLIKGNYHLAGELRHIPMDFSSPIEELTRTPEGMHEALYKELLTICVVTSPDLIVVYGELLSDTDALENELNTYIKAHIPQFKVNLKQVDSLQEYIMNGLLAECFI